MIPHPVMLGDRDQYIQQIKAQSANWHRIGKAVSNFLSTAFPQAKNEAEEVGLSIVNLMTTGDEEQIKRLSEPQPTFSSYGPNPTAVLARLVEDRDRLVSQIEMAERGLEAMRDDGRFGAVADVMAASSLVPLQNALAQIEEQISSVQESMES